MVLDEFRLHDHIAVLAGCGRHRMKDLALALTEAGATVAVTGPDRVKLDGIVAETLDMGGEAMAIPADLSNPGEVQRVTEKILLEFGKVDILVNDFNSEFGKPVLETDEEEWIRVMDANLKTVFLCSKIVGRHMVERESGRIINIVTGAAERGLPNNTARCAGMGGVVQFTRALALEWASHNIGVNGVGVGWMAETAKQETKDPVGRYIPMGRRARGEDITPMVVFLASEASSYLSGCICYADGGLMNNY